jgi:hypothetical protein
MGQPSCRAVVQKLLSCLARPYRDVLRGTNLLPRIVELAVDIAPSPDKRLARPTNVFLCSLAHLRHRSAVGGAPSMQAYAFSRDRGLALPNSSRRIQRSVDVAGKLYSFLLRGLARFTAFRRHCRTGILSSTSLRTLSVPSYAVCIERYLSRLQAARQWTGRTMPLDSESKSLSLQRCPRSSALRSSRAPLEPVLPIPRACQRLA